MIEITTQISLHNKVVFPFLNLKSRMNGLGYVDLDKEALDDFLTELVSPNQNKAIGDLLKHTSLSTNIKKLKDLSSKSVTSNTVRIPNTLIKQICESLYSAVDQMFGVKNMPGDYSILKDNRVDHNKKSWATESDRAPVTWAR